MGVMVGSHVLPGLVSSLTKDNLYLSWACLLSSCTNNNIPLDYQSNPLFLDRAQSLTRTQITEPLIVSLFSCIPFLCSVNYSIPTKEVCAYPFYFSSDLGNFPTLLFSASLIYHQWISCKHLMSSPLILLYKIRCKTAIFWSIFSVYWDFASWQMSSVWLKSTKKFSTGLDVSTLTRDYHIDIGWPAVLQKEVISTILWYLQMF